MGNVTTIDHTFIEDWFESYIREATRNPQVVGGGTQKEQARAEGNLQGTLKGLRMGLAMHINQMRRDMFRDLPTELKDAPSKTWQWIPTISDYDLVGWLNTVVDRWTNGDWSDVSDKQFMADVRGELDERAYTTQLVEDYDARRKTAIRGGLMEPGKNDLAWLREEYEAMTAVAQPLRQLIEHAESKE